MNIKAFLRTLLGAAATPVVEGQRVARGHSSIDAMHLSDGDRAAVLAILKGQGGDERNARDIASAVGEFNRRRVSEVSA
jgi:hypothetical protein